MAILNFKKYLVPKLAQYKAIEETGDDITARKHGGNPQSRAAHSKAASKAETQRDAVVDVLSRSPRGMTMKEIAQCMDVQLNTISGRGTELLRSGRIYRTGETRDGSAVLKVSRDGVDDWTTRFYEKVGE